MIKKVKYRVKSAFGCEQIGSIVKGRIIIEDKESALAVLYFPSDDEYSCGCLTMCKKGEDGIYEETSVGAYFNMDEDINDAFKAFIKREKDK